MKEHTEGEWMFIEGNKSNGIENHFFLGTIQDSDPLKGYHIAAIWGDLGPASRANADHIVHMHNNWDEVMETLKKIANHPAATISKRELSHKYDTVRAMSLDQLKKLEQ